MTAGRRQRAVSSKNLGIRHRGRIFVLICLLPAVFLPAGSVAQQPEKVPRIGLLVLGSASTESARIQAFRRGLREHGYVEGQNIAIEYRYGEGKIDRLPALVAELVRLKVVIIVTRGTEAIRASREATKTIPIVMAQSSDPVTLGFVASLARPGGNITGITSISQQLIGKRFALLKEVVPKLSQVGMLWNPENPLSESNLTEMQDAARALAVKPQMLEVRDDKDLDRAFSSMRQARTGAFAVAPGGFFTTNRRRIVELASNSRLPAIYGGGEYVEAGGLMSYGVNFVDNTRRAAAYVDKILKGAKPADLPVEQPVKFEFVINLKTAKQIGLTIPPNVLARADRVIR
jgi:putative ABC transport system substrate-binding protein